MFSRQSLCNYSKDNCCELLLNLYPRVQTAYTSCPKGSLSDLLNLVANYVKPVYDRSRCGRVTCCRGIVNAYFNAVRAYLGNENASLCQLEGVLGCILGQIGLVPTVVGSAKLILDNGIATGGAFFAGDPQQFLFLNRFTPSSYPFVLEEIQIYFASSGPGGDTNVQVGDPIDLYVWQNVTGNPDAQTGAAFQDSLTGQTVQVLDAFNSYSLPSPIAFYGPGDILIGFVNRLALDDPRYSPGYGIGAYSLTNPQNRSWLGYGYPSDTAPDPPTFIAPGWLNVGTEFGFNWMIRGFGCGGSQNPNLILTRSSLGGSTRSIQSTLDRSVFSLREISKDNQTRDGD